MLYVRVFLQGTALRACLFGQSAPQALPAGRGTRQEWRIVYTLSP